LIHCGCAGEPLGYPGSDVQATLTPYTGRASRDLIISHSSGQIVKGFVQLRVHGTIGREFKVKFPVELGDRKLLEELLCVR
jgi:hypothetical protein